MSTVSIDENLYSALEEAVSVLRNIAEYQFESEVTERMRTLGEEKDACSPEDREVHRQLADFWRRRTLQKLQALSSLRRLQQVAPQLVGEPPETSVVEG